MTEEREYTLLLSIKEALERLEISEPITVDILFRISGHINKE